jgi:hypothetical protein
LDFAKRSSKSTSLKESQMTETPETPVKTPTKTPTETPTEPFNPPKPEQVPEPKN